MRNAGILMFILLTIGLLSSCHFVGNYFRYRDTTKDLVNNILKNDYDNALKLFALEHASFEGIDRDTLKARLSVIHDNLVDNFGDHLDYAVISVEKKWAWSTKNEEGTLPNTTVVLMQISNKKNFGVLQLLFEDTSKKVLSLRKLRVMEPIPSMTLFWLFGLLAICIPAFNIYMIVRVKRSQFKKKWLKYLAIILLNVPAITYKSIGGLSFGLLSFQILLGVSFSYMSYLNSAWTFGLPLGGLYMLWQLYNGKDKLIEERTSEITMAEGQTYEDENLENKGRTEI